MLGRKPFVTPFGGPASGLWPSGRRRATQTPSGASPTPPAGCTEASLFADCFGACAGTIEGASPGPVCGWTFVEPFGALGGSIALSAGQMSFDTTLATQYPGAQKALLASLPDILGISGKFTFTEFPTAPVAETTYQIFILNQDLSRVVSVSFFGDGSCAVQVGDVASAPMYIGTWTPDGGTHEVYFEISAGGVPTLYLDGLDITPPLFGDVPTFGASMTADAVSVFLASGANGAASGIVTDLFITAGAPGVSTEFCCPT